jgi:hypothetical protein
MKLNQIINETENDSNLVSDRKNIEIRTQSHQMDAEGMHEFKPSKQQIVQFLNKEGYNASNIDIGFDSSQKFWRWTADIKKK